MNFLLTIFTQPLKTGVDEQEHSFSLVQAFKGLDK